MASYKDIDLDGLIDFGDFGDLLKKSGITVSDMNKSQDNPVIDDSSDKHDDSSDKHDDESKLDFPKDNKQKKKSLGSPDSKNAENTGECVICYNPLYMKLTLPCGHFFCYGCIKGQILRLKQSQNACCPLCNQMISDKIKDKIKKNPHLLKSIEIDKKHLENLDAYWFYSARQKGDWWSFDVSASKEIEVLYQRYMKDEDVSDCNLSICGMTLSFDFDDMLQINEYSGGSRKIRRVRKCDIDNFMSNGSVKGLAGYKASI
jgi:hypothetical protein